MSMYEQLPFQPAQPSEIDRLVAAHPLATLISADSDGRQLATPLPLVLQRDAAGEGWLIGHISRRNPQLALLQRQPRALATFMGAQGYIASSWLRDRRYAPTWNYEFVQFELELAIEDTPQAIQHALELLCAQVEAPYPQPWQPSEMGPRMAQLAQYVVPFKARITATRAQFKLGQGDPASLLEDAHSALLRYGQYPLSEAMRRHERLSAAQQVSA